MKPVHCICLFSRPKRFYFLLFAVAAAFLRLAGPLNSFGAELLKNIAPETLTVASARPSSAANESQKKPASNTAKKAEQPGKKETVVLEGTIDGEGTFTFREDKIFYRHSQFDYPEDVSINGRAWSNLNEPFDLGFEPDFASAECLEKSGRNTIRFTSSADKAELYLFDTDGSSARYRVSMAFSVSAKTPSGSKGNGSSGSSAKASAARTTGAPRPNEMLQGVVYDLKRTKSLKPSNLIGGNADNYNSAVDGELLGTITKPFVNGPDSTWRNTTDSRGNIRYPYFDNNYYCLPTRLFNSFFYMENKEWSEAPKMLHAEKDLQGGGWIAIYSGYVVAPFTGIFRFVGFADDAILVRFNKNIVLDYGWYSLTMGMFLYDFGDGFRDLLSGKRDPTAAQRSKLQESVLFSKFKMDFWSANSDNGNPYNHGLQRGVPIKVQKGQVFPIEIVISEHGNGDFSTMLFVERLDDKGKPYKTYPEKLPLFRTTAHLPPHPTLSWFPDFEDEGPIWKVVDSSGKPIPASRFAGQKYAIGFQADSLDSTVQKAAATAAATTQKTESANYEDELPGVLYDLKRTSNGESTGLMEMQEGKQFNRLRTMVYVWNLPDTAGKESVMVPYLKRFVVSNWPYRTDSGGNIFFSEFSQFSRSPVNLYQSYFYQPLLSSENAPRTISGDSRVSNAGWIGINAGYVVAPFTGKFRFVGYGDDALVVRFDNQIVLDYGVYALTLGKKLDDTWDWKAILGGTAAKTDPQNRMVLNNPVYSRCKLETYFPSLFDKRGLAKGVPISVTKGKHYPVEILVADIEQNKFGTALLIERLDSNGVPLKNDPAKLPLFRTSSELPGHSSGSFPDFDENSPIWRVVDSKGKPIQSHKQVIAETQQETKTKESSSLVVTTAKNVVNANDGVTSIREAISYAKSLGGVQTISFNMPNGDNITISNPDLIYHELRFASSNKATGNPVTVTLDKLNISGRRCSSEENDHAVAGGGVLHAHDANIVVSGGKYTNNQNSGRYGWGGVIRMIGGTLTVDGTIFDSNSSGNCGGAINCDSLTNVTIRNTHFIDNSASGIGGGGLLLWCSPASYLIDTDFVGNSTVENDYTTVQGGAIRVHESILVYEVTAGKIITNVNNTSGIGGFIVLTGEWANVEFKVNGTLNIGNGNGKDSFQGVPAESESRRDYTLNKTIRKTGSGTMTINAPVSDYRGQWIVEDGILNLNYGGSFAGPITVNGGRLIFDKDYTFTRLMIGLDAKKKDAYVGGVSHLSGGKYCISIDAAIPKGSYLLAEDVNRLNDPVTVQTKNGTSLGTLVVGRETVIGDGSGMLTLDGGKLSLSVLAPINPQNKANTDAEPQTQPQRDPNLKKVVSTTTRGNVTTQTVTEYNGDTTIETVTTTEVNGDTTVETVTMTETKNGKVVKKTTTTTTTTNTNQSIEPSPSSSSQASGAEKQDTSSNSSTPSSAETKTDPAREKSKPAHNPFGYTKPLPED